MLRVKVIKSCPGKWYRKGEVYTVKSLYRYEGIGVQVFRPGMTGTYPDVIADEDWEWIEEE